jgi:hypothetical protein
LTAVDAHFFTSATRVRRLKLRERIQMIFFSGRMRVAFNPRRIVEDIIASH